MHGLVNLPFGDGDYPFRLTLGGIAAIEAKFDRSIFILIAECQMKTARSAAIFEIIREGLIGAGMAHIEANRMVARYSEEVPLLVHCALAYQIGLAGMMRVHSEALADPPGEQTAPASPDGSTSAPSSETPS